MAFLGHVIRSEGLENLTMAGIIAGSRGRGRPRRKYLGRVKELIGGATTQKFLNMMTDQDSGGPHRQWLATTEK